MFWRILHKACDSSGRQCHYGLIITIIQHNGLCVCARKAAQFFLKWMQSLCKQNIHRYMEREKSYIENNSGSHSDGGQINTAFGYFKKMIEEAHRQPRAAPGLQCCVYLESYSWGEGKEQQSSNSATESLFLVLFAVGSFRMPFPSSPPQIKSSTVRRQKEQAPKEDHHINLKIRCCQIADHSPSFFRICAKSSACWCNGWSRVS